MSAGEATWTKDEVLEVAKRLRGEAVRQFAKDGEYSPRTYLFGTRAVGTGNAAKSVFLIPAVWAGEQEKAAYAAVVRKLAHATGAVGVIFVAESWTVRTRELDLESARKVIGAIGGVSKHPEREEVILFTCEHVRFGASVWTAPIVRTEGKRAHVGSWEGEGFRSVGGQFVHLLPPAN